MAATAGTVHTPNWCDVRTGRRRFPELEKRFRLTRIKVNTKRRG